MAVLVTSLLSSSLKHPSLFTLFLSSQVSYCRNTASEEEKEMKRLREEVAMMGRLHHRNVVRCLGAVHVQGHFNIFVEWMAGTYVRT